MLMLKVLIGVCFLDAYNSGIKTCGDCAVMLPDTASMCSESGFDSKSFHSSFEVKSYLQLSTVGYFLLAFKQSL